MALADGEEARLVKIGQVVEYIADNRFVIGVCLELKKDRPRLLTEANREIVLPVRRLVYPDGPIITIDSSREELAARLKETAARREKLKLQVDLSEIWELVADEVGEEPLDPAFAAGLLFGEPVDFDHISAVIRAVIDDKIYFRYRPEGLVVTSAEKVESLMAQRARAEELARERETAGGWLAEVWAGREPAPPADAEEIIERLIDVAVFGAESRQFSRVKSYLDAAGIKSRDAAFKLLVKLGRFDEDEDLEIRRLGLPTSFPDEVTAEAENVADSPPDEERWSDRADLTGLETFTIDGAETKDFDDALSLVIQGGRRTVYIHITDVTPFVAPGSALDVEARSRASSIYLPDRRLPMLPPVLSEGLLSLTEGRLRPALSLKVELDESAEIMGYNVVKSRVRVDRRLTYDQADALIETEPGLAELHKLAVKLKERRLRDGAMVLETPEVAVRVGEDGRVEVERFEEPGPSRMMIAEMMVLANRLIAATLAQAGVPTLFRAQDPPTTSFDPPEGADPLWVTLRRRMLFNRLELTTCPTPHAGMGLPAYTTFTSPIRRYLDLVTIRQLSALLDGVMPPYNEPDLEDLCQSLAPLLRAHNQLRFRRHRYWLLKYLAQHPDREWEALVLDRLHDRFSLVLLETMLRAASPKLDASALTPGQRIKVRTTRIDPRDDVLRLEIV